jgi:putative NIF3 family GTP cyclohydrolase 1 type 2
MKNNRGLTIPIGRICTPINYPNEKTAFILEHLIKRLKQNLNLTSVLFVGDLRRTINKICIVGGDVSNSKLIKKAIDLGCDCFISGKFDYLDAVFARDVGFNLIEASHYKIEILGMKKLVNILSLEFPHVEFRLFESKDPFKIYI